MRKKGKAQAHSDIGSNGVNKHAKKGDHEISEGYESKELHICELEFDEEDIGKLVGFRKEKMSRDFQFTVDLDFSSIQELKEEILEYSILNGRQIMFRPNDRVSARVKCNKKYGYEILQQGWKEFHL